MAQLVEVRGKKYKLVYGIYFSPNTPDDLCSIIARYKGRDVRLRFFFGDAKTGKSWNETDDVMGYVGTSCGPVFVPLLIKKSNSSGGGMLSTDSIIRITVEGKDIYKHPKFHIGKAVVQDVMDPTLRQKGYTHAVAIDGEEFYRTQSKEKAERFIAFLKGEINKI